MMRTVLSLAILFVASALAGCITNDAPQILDDDAALGIVEVFPDPRTATHPAFGWPTMSDPYGAQGKLLNAWLRPIEPAQLPDPITDLKPLAKPDNVISGAGIAVLGSLAIVPGHGENTTILDISDPAAPKVLSTLPHAGNVTARDVDTMVHPDGTIIAIFATNQGRNPIWDITDPTDPKLIADIRPTGGSHNVAVVPGTPILYNSNSGGGNSDGLAGRESYDPATAAGITEIFDLSDLSDPDGWHVADWKNGYGCHDITFWLNDEQDKYRAYCAGIEMTQIWDIADPLNPQVITNVPVHHGNTKLPHGSVPIVLFSHLAMVSHDADVLIVGDETGGGLAMACDKYIDGEIQTASGPFGNLWFYDLSDEKDPVLKSWFSPDPSYVQNPPTTQYVDPADPEGTVFDSAFGQAGCTAHFGRNIDDTDMLVMGFYGAGTLLVDYSDIMHPVIVDQYVGEGTNVWDAWYYQGYVFTGDMGRGMDILSLA